MNFTNLAENGFDGLDLDPDHARMLAASAITLPVAQARGYRTVRSAADIDGLNFVTRPETFPALLIPIYGVSGTHVGYQLRPNNPRLRDGKPLKYESPVKTPPVLDIPQTIQKKLSNPSHELWITEGARKADAIASLDQACIGLSGVWNFRGTNPAGGKVALGDWEVVALNNRFVFIAFDSDLAEKPGVRHACERLAMFLRSRGSQVAIVHIPSGPKGEKQGIDDYIAAGGTLAELRKTATELAPVFTSPTIDAERQWPDPPHPDAFLGLAKRVIDELNPYTESDPVALLVNLLIAFGNAIGQKPHAKVGATRHGTNEFAVLAGRSSKARKGDSWSPIEALLKMADPEYLSRIQNGSATGEGIIMALKDADVTSGESWPGTDKRLLLVESEFARVLRVMDRQGSTLSPVLRDSWDGRDLRVLTKTAPMTATAPHVSVLAHVTAEELKHELGSVDVANGFANRFLFVAVRRSKIMPNPPVLSASILQPLADELRDAIELARTTELVERDPIAAERWKDIYLELSDERNGVLGSLTARSEAHVLRLSMLYALLNQSAVVRLEHLNAAFALWNYCEDSLEYLFGDGKRDNTAQRLLDALVERDMTRTEIRDLFNKNLSRKRIDTALDSLEAAGLVERESIETGGRPAELWKVAD